MYCFVFHCSFLTIPLTSAVLICGELILAKRALCRSGFGRGVFLHLFVESIVC
jgi:hypothetical protein